MYTVFNLSCLIIKDDFYSKGVTMSTILRNPAGSKFISFIWIIENKILKNTRNKKGVQ